ncbi:MAG: radical SAM protein [Gemmatimonadota bacterium]|jgi:radical SAM protein with 4Fe4S-binding SPASM domain
MRLPVAAAAGAFAPEGEPVGDVEGGVPTPHVVAWNLTRRCNLACAHCYISAGSWHGGEDELDTSTALGVLDDVLDVNPSPVLILSGGEPLLRDDLETLAERAAGRGATVVVGTNGTRLTDARVGSLMDAGVRGVAVSVDSLRAGYHDRFRNAAAGPDVHGGRGGAGSLEATLAAVERCRSRGLDFIVQTTVTRGNVDELDELLAWAADAGAVAFNVYFLVATGRGSGMRGLSPEENDVVLRRLLAAEGTYRGRMMVRSKCQPQIMRHAVDADDGSPLLNYSTRCPCGVHYARITPEGKLTPCPYTPVVAGDLLRDAFGDVWRTSPVLRRIRSGRLGGKCGDCRYRDVCGGCRARAYAETGDLMGPDPSCAYEPPGFEEAVEPRATATYGAPAEPALSWTDEARRRLERAPSFVRGVITERVEAFARERGHARVDAEVLAQVRRSLPVDFSKRLPNFLRDRRNGKGADA